MLPKSDMEFLENWMSVLKDAIRNTKLRDLKVPGTHDSNTYTFGGFSLAASFAKCQKITITEQLNMGVRMLDLRYGPNEKVLNVPDALAKKLPVIVDQHGPVAGGDFMKHLNEIRTFVEKHPDEFIFLNVQWEKQMDHNRNQYLIGELSRIFSEYLIKKSDLETWFHPMTVTFGDVLNHRPRILLVTRSSLWNTTYTSGDQCAEMGIHENNRFLASRWHDEHDPDRLFAANADDINKRDVCEDLQNHFLVSQLIITLKSDMKFILGHLFTGTYPTISQMNKKLHKSRALQKFLFWALKNGKGNIFMFDFIDHDPLVPMLIVAANSDPKLAIKKFVVEEKSLMSKAADHSLQDKALFLPKVKYTTRNIGLESSQLLIAYSFGGRPVQVGMWEGQQTVLIYHNPLKEFQELHAHSYLVFLRSGKFSLQVAIDDEEFRTLSQNLTNTKKAVKGFWIPGMPNQDYSSLMAGSKLGTQQSIKNGGISQPDQQKIDPSLTRSDGPTLDNQRQDSLDPKNVRIDPQGEGWRATGELEPSPVLQNPDSPPPGGLERSKTLTPTSQ